MQRGWSDQEHLLTVFENGDGVCSYQPLEQQAIAHGLKGAQTSTLALEARRYIASRIENHDKSLFRTRTPYVGGHKNGPVKPWSPMWNHKSQNDATVAVTALWWFELFDMSQIPLSHSFIHGIRDFLAGKRRNVSTRRTDNERGGRIPRRRRRIQGGK